jgi:hypothetical protein
MKTKLARAAVLVCLVAVAVVVWLATRGPSSPGERADSPWRGEKTRTPTEEREAGPTVEATVDVDGERSAPDPMQSGPGPKAPEAAPKPYELAEAARVSGCPPAGEVATGSASSARRLRTAPSRSPG